MENKEAILGVFYSNYYYPMIREHDWIGYDRFSQYFEVEWENKSLRKPIFVHMVYETFSKINFLLDKIKLPLNSDISVTCAELQIIIDSNYLDKVQFWLKGEKIDKDKVLEIFKLTVDGDLTFDNINFA